MGQKSCKEGCHAWPRGCLCPPESNCWLLSQAQWTKGNPPSALGSVGSPSYPEATKLIVQDLLGGIDLPKPRYVHLVEEVVEGLRTGQYPLASLVMPAGVDHIRTISLGGQRMPAKSTYFYPKLLSGLVINPLE